VRNAIYNNTNSVAKTYLNASNRIRVTLMPEKK